ncbi:putative type III effector [Paraburkholderia ribeironis]|uniref:Putative type III effector n=1 Tax=Paraburkholderia ribeironis TaxID=1247936 RepID=A0A1N7SLR5_9BURK|nr:hypothetical protein [Paraburkholderia ribeironis]SIT48371.1 putative type III effector [Paraburkholderia ribeironis]
MIGFPKISTASQVTSEADAEQTSTAVASTPSRPHTGYGALHELVSADRLQRKDYSAPVRQVRTETLDNLHRAQATVVDVKQRLSYGQGNQLPDIVQTWGESYVRMSYARHRATLRSEGGTSEAELHQHAEAALAFQAGNCGDTAALSYLHLAGGPSLNAPLLLVSDQEQDHDYALIGDPRDSRWGTKNTVVVDAWTQFPSAYTLADADGLMPCPADHERPPGTEPSTDARRLFDSSETVSSKSIAGALEQDKHAEIGPKLLKEVLEDADPSELWDVRTGALDPSTRYTDGASAPTSFDHLPQSLIRRQEAAIDAMERYQREPGNKLRGS